MIHTHVNILRSILECLKYYVWHFTPLDILMDNLEISNRESKQIGYLNVHLISEKAILRDIDRNGGQLSGSNYRQELHTFTVQNLFAFSQG